MCTSREQADAAPAFASLLVVGCGLMGTSLALAVRRAWPGIRIAGVEAHPDHRQSILARAAVDQVWPDLHAVTEVFDLCVLAVPADAACALLPQAARCARWVMDICSVKAPLTAAATAAGLTERFAPTHPMAGLASAGPDAAQAKLFQGRSWILLSNWPACAAVEPLVRSVGAQVRWLASADEHDQAMAAVSHGVHLISCAAAHVYGRLAGERAAAWAGLAGPGFRDITRLAAAPPGFWVSTLLHNRAAVLPYLQAASRTLDELAQALASENTQALTQWLLDAQEVRTAWERNGGLAWP
ncbi:MAG: prephenate dehydrogenase/arogenate dehydrogenase family protein [Alicyclobacillus sp.]|nr:prephenate dehydrogenase/arogenate dehydrogenase family protein [Alicyclobacillus sp.]